MHGYVHFAEFGGLINNAMKPKKCQTQLKISFNTIQTHTISIYNMDKLGSVLLTNII